MDEDEPRDETDKLFKKLNAPLVDLSGIQGAERFTSRTGLYGFHRSMAHTYFNTMTAGFVQAHCAGRFDMIVFEIESFLQATAKIKGVDVTNPAFESSSVTNINDIVEEVANMDDGYREMLVANGMKARHLKVMPKTLSFVPCGWICAEISRSEGGEQIYGYRKNVFIKNRENVEAFRWAQLSFAAANSGAHTKMMEIYKAMAASEPLEETLTCQEDESAMRAAGA